MTRLGLSIVLLLVCGCGAPGQTEVAIPLHVAGTGWSEPVMAVGGVSLLVERADLAFGPLYFCAGAQAGDLCDTARLEWLESTVVDTLSPEPTRVGELVGVTGPVRSWMFDLGIGSQLTRSQPFVLEAAAALGGASFVLAGSARIEGMEIPFRASVPVQQTEATELGVPVVRKSASDRFVHDVQADEAGLLLRFDARPWIASIDLRPFVEDSLCAPDGPPVVCARMIEQTCDALGTTTATRDCSALGQICIAETGCADELILEPDSEAFRSLRIALVSSGRPSFEWGFTLE